MLNRVGPVHEQQQKKMLGVDDDDESELISGSSIVNQVPFTWFRDASDT